MRKGRKRVSLEYFNYLAKTLCTRDAPRSQMLFCAIMMSPANNKTWLTACASQNLVSGHRLYYRLREHLPKENIICVLKHRLAEEQQRNVDDIAPLLRYSLNTHEQATMEFLLASSPTTLNHPTIADLIISIMIEKDKSHPQAIFLLERTLKNANQHLIRWYDWIELAIHSKRTLALHTLYAETPTHLKNDDLIFHILKNLVIKNVHDELPIWLSKIKLVSWKAQELKVLAKNAASWESQIVLDVIVL